MGSPHPKYLNVHLYALIKWGHHYIRQSWIVIGQPWIAIYSQQCMLGMHVKESAIFVKAFLIDITNVLKEIVFYKYYMVAAALQSNIMADQQEVFTISTSTLKFEKQVLKQKIYEHTLFDKHGCKIP